MNFSENADIYVINTCSVTENADKRFKTIVKQAQKSNPNAFVAAIGTAEGARPHALAGASPLRGLAGGASGDRSGGVPAVRCRPDPEAGLLPACSR